MTNLPVGTLTFLFTDIEGSTQLWEKQSEAMQHALAQHDSILKKVIESNNGHVIKMTGDGIHAVFATAIDAVNATLAAAHNFQSPISTLPIKIRIGLHTGEAELRDADYYGQSLNRAARIMSAGHGGQILLSSITAELVRDQLPADAVLLDLGEHRLKDLTRPEHIFQLTAPDLPKDFPTLKSLNTFPNNLPIQVTSFIGREKELAEIKTLLASSRLVTLTGSGGTGKTRLAIEVGAQEFSVFPHGVWLVELAPLTDESQMIPAIAQIFGLQEHPFGPLEELVIDYLRDKKLLLILDNCEHLIEACARLADKLLRLSPGLRILASSREALGIAGEAAYRTPSLGDSESTRLFAERARAVNSNFSLTHSNAPSIAQICSRLDGIPLAIELAAARSKLLSPEQLAARLDDRFRLLIGGSRTALPRQQTLRALIDWSYDLLPDEEKQLFRTASVFVGGWALEALEAMAGSPNTIENLEQLVNKSLVITEERGGEMRYFMLETIRQYAREKLFDLREASAVRDQHFHYYDDLVENTWKLFTPENFRIWRARADDEVENLRAALEWGLDNHPEQAIRLAGNFCLLTGWMGSWQMEGLALGRAAIERVKALPPGEEKSDIERMKLLARALFAQGLVGMGTGEMPVVIRDLQEAIEIARAAGDKRILGYSLEIFFTATRFIDAPGGEEAAEEGYKIFHEQVNDHWGRSLAYQNKTRLATMRGDVAGKEKYQAMFRELIRETPLSLQAGLFYLGMGMSEVSQGNDAAGKTYFEDGLNIFQHIRNKNFQLIMQSELGHIARRAGKIMDAKGIYSETLRGWQDVGHRGAIANQLECFAFISIIENQLRRAAKLFGAAEAVREKIDAPMTAPEQIEYDQCVAQVRSQLDETECSALWGDGRAMTMEQAIELALTEL